MKIDIDSLFASKVSNVKKLPMDTSTYPCSMDTINTSYGLI